MKTTLLLNDETTRATLLLENVAWTELSLREPEAVAGCNCDRWGHPCPGCGNGKVETKAERPFLLPLDE